MDQVLGGLQCLGSLGLRDFGIRSRGWGFRRAVCVGRLFNHTTAPGSAPTPQHAKVTLDPWKSQKLSSVPPKDALAEALYLHRPESLDKQSAFWVGFSEGSLPDDMGLRTLGVTP